MKPLSALIRSEIEGSPRTGWKTDGSLCRCISFRKYMSLCLYHPEYGYYRSGKPRTGRDGDFYTSAYVGDTMGVQLAERLAELVSEKFPDGAAIEAVDWGGGSGRLGLHMLGAWAQMGQAGKRFSLTMVDGNPEHRRQASETMAEQILAGRARILSPAEAEAENWKKRKTVVVANELLDAFPVRRVTQSKGRLWEWAVAWDERLHRPASCRMEPADPSCADWLVRQGVQLAEGQTTEIGLEGAGWPVRIASLLGDAILVLIDYGGTTAELTAPYRMEGTLLCYEKHLAHSDPFRNPGGQDITAHIDFDLIRQRAEGAGWREIWYGTQKHFLLESGILAKLADHGISDPFHPVVRRNRSIRQLLLSDGMSELFKVQILCKP